MTTLGVTVFSVVTTICGAAWGALTTGTAAGAVAGAIIAGTVGTCDTRARCSRRTAFRSGGAGDRTATT